MIDLQALRNEIDTGPLSALCEGKSDNEIADILNDTSYFKMIKETFVNTRTIQDKFPADGVDILDALELASSSIPEVKWAMKSMVPNQGGIDVALPSTRAQLDMLVLGGILNAAQVEAIKNLALKPASRAEILGWDTVTYDDVNRARALA